MPVRFATPEDVPAVVAMVEHFIADTPYGAFVSPDRARITANVEAVLMHGAIVLGLDGVRIVGMLGLLPIEDPFTGIRTAVEPAFWVEPDARGGRLAYQMLGRAEEIARQMGCACLKMAAPVGSPVGRLYQRRGYRPVETSFQFDL